VTATPSQISWFKGRSTTLEQLQVCMDPNERGRSHMFWHHKEEGTAVLNTYNHINLLTHQKVMIQIVYIHNFISTGQKRKRKVM
jgi:hypothetical protein